MAKKSTNTQGNPWHDEGTGEFTSQNGGGTPNPNENEESKAMGLMGLDKTSPKEPEQNQTQPVSKPRNISKTQDMDYIIQAAKQRMRTMEYDKKGLAFGRDLKECEQIGTNILGVGIVAYSESLDVNYANQLNQALFDIKNDFPRLMESLARFGTGAATAEEVEKIKENANKRFFELTRSLNIKTPDDKKWLEDYINDVLGNDSIKSYARSLLGAVERGRGGTLGYYSPSKVSSAPQNLTDQRNKEIQEASINRNSFGSTREISFYSITGLSTIQMNPDYINRDEFKKGTVYEGDGFHYANSKGAAYMTGAHELGHFVDIMLSGNFMNADELKQRHELFEKIRKNPKVSGYAKHNYLETAAEAFGDVYSNGANALPENIEYVNYMKQMYTKYLENWSPAVVQQ